ncbi:MAG TPA: PqqD family peptide modification chaperone [Gammaproteobacteria bacterium]|nr:PqqD family peptide modification chaperone [Gammaproteobacteria bacterium]
MREHDFQESSIADSSTVCSCSCDVLIVFFNRMFGGSLDLENYHVPGVIFSEDRSLASVADVLVIHTPQNVDRHNQLQNKPPGQLWVSWSIESDTNYPNINDDVYDLKMTYQRSADIWIPYCRNYGPDLYEKIAQSSQTKENSCVIASFISSVNNQSQRLEYLTELSHHIDVHHYGRFMKNRTIGNDAGAKSKIEVLSRYKFAIAFENSISPDYVTEKFYDPLLVGTIPVYLGAPNISDYAPGHDCYIDINDFNSPADLARYLKKLDQDDTLLERYMKWKNEPLRAQFVDQIETFAELPHSFIQLAELAKKHIGHFNGVVPHKRKGWKLKTSKGVGRLTNMRSGRSIKLDGSGLLIWELSDGERTIAQIQNYLAAAYPNQAKQIRHDVTRTLRIFRQHGLVELI